MNKWNFDESKLNDMQGFVYRVTELDTGKMYIGKKNLWSKRTLPPLKGKKNKRHKIVESDWKTYCTSSPELSKKMKENPDNYKLRVLHYCESKQDLAILETCEQINCYLDGTWDSYYNEVINIRVRVRKKD